MSRFIRKPPIDNTNQPPGERQQPSSTRITSLRDLQRIKINVPPAITNAGLVLVIKFTNTGIPEVGYVKHSELPVIRPLDDLTKLGAAPRIISGIEASSSSETRLSEIINSAARDLLETSRDPLPKPNAQAELLRMKAYADVLQEVEQIIIRKDRDPLKSLFQKCIHSAHKAISDYSHSEILSSSDDKFSDFLLRRGVPKFIFDKIVNRSYLNEFSNKNLLDILFPRKLSKALVLTKLEINSPEIRRNLVEISDSLDAFVEFAKEAKDDEKVYCPPLNFTERCLDSDDLPVQRLDQSSGVQKSIERINQLFANFEPLLQTEDAFLKHAQRFRIRTVKPTQSGNTSAKDEAIKAAVEFVELEPFKKDKDSIESLRKQYMKFLSVKLNQKVFTFDGIDLSVKDPYQQPLQLAKSYFSPIKVEKDEEFRISELKQKLGFKPKEMRLVNYQANCTLTKEAKSLLSALERGKAPESFVKNVKGFLGSFVTQELMDMAVNRMRAALQQRTIILDDNPEEDNPDENSDEVITY